MQDQRKGTQQQLLAPARCALGQDMMLAVAAQRLAMRPADSDQVGTGRLAPERQGAGRTLCIAHRIAP
ncbi:hypothetical protein D3C80_1399770 [compost metagenome]